MDNCSTVAEFFDDKVASEQGSQEQEVIHLDEIVDAYRRKCKLERRIRKLRKTLKDREPSLLESLRSVKEISVEGVNLKLKTSKRSAGKPNIESVAEELQNLITEVRAGERVESADDQLVQTIFDLCHRKTETEAQLKESIVARVEDDDADSDRD
jgi:hypothetical protein